MDTAQLDQVERLTPYRWGLLGLAAVIVLGGAIPWRAQVKADRARHWSQTLAWDRYRLEGGAKVRMRAQVENNVVNPMAKEQMIETLKLDEPATGKQTTEPEPVNYLPPFITIAAFLGALAAVIGSDAVRRLQVDQIQAVADSARRQRADAAPTAPDPEERAAQDTLPLDPEEAGHAARANVTTQPVMDVDTAEN